MVAPGGQEVGSKAQRIVAAAAARKEPPDTPGSVARQLDFTMPSTVAPNDVVGGCFHVTIGIDPGQTGALAILADEVFRGFVDMPVMPRPSGKGEMVDPAELARQLRAVLSAWPGSTYLAVLEQVSAAPIEGRQQGGQSMFNFGEGVGVIRGVVAALGIPLIRVHPAKWKRALDMPKGGKDEKQRAIAKDASRTIASQRFPAAASSLTRKKDVGRADALLIALYARRHELLAET